MKKVNFRLIPPGVLLIAAIYVMGGLVLLVSNFTDPTAVSPIIATVHGLLPIMGKDILLAVSVLALILAYGLISLSRWGFFLAISYSLYLTVISLCMGGVSFLWTGQEDQSIFFGNLLWSLLVVMYLLVVRGRFITPRQSDSSC